MKQTILAPDRDAAIVTAQGEYFGNIPDDVRGMFAAKVYHKEDSGTATGVSLIGEVFINPEYEYHPDVVQLQQLFKVMGLSPSITNVTSSEIREMYDKSDKNSSSQSSIQRDIKEYFNVAANQDASDMHITVKENGSFIQIRTQGDLYRFKDLTSEQGNSYCRTIYTTMCDVSDKSFTPTKSQGGRIAQLYLPDKLTGVRIQTTPTENGYKMICRLLYSAKDSSNDLLSLGYESFHQDMVEYFMSKKSGVVIVCGPTGSGKSTTLEKICSQLISNTNGTQHLVTVEDPPEYEISGECTVKEPVYDEKGLSTGFVEKKVLSFAAQIPVINAKTPELKSQKFNEAIATAMRLDPDIMMIGEIRDPASASAALKAAITGHQVWTTLHANNGLTVFSRLFDIGAKRELVCDPEVVMGLIAQRLVKKVCPNCAIPLLGHEELIDASLMKRINEVFSENGIGIENIKLRNFNGCSECNNTGIKGRTVVAEIIKCDDNFMELTREGKRVELKRYWLNNLKGVTMLMHGIIKISQGSCDPRDVEAQTEHLSIPDESDKESFVNLVNSLKDL